MCAVAEMVIVPRRTVNATKSPGLIAGFFGDGLGDGETRFFDEHGHCRLADAAFIVGQDAILRAGCQPALPRVFPERPGGGLATRRRLTTTAVQIGTAIHFLTF